MEHSNRDLVPGRESNRPLPETEHDALAGVPAAVVSGANVGQYAADTATAAIEEVCSLDVCVTETVRRERKVDQSSLQVTAGNGNEDGCLGQSHRIARAMPEANDLVCPATARTGCDDVVTGYDGRRRRVIQRLNRRTGGKHSGREHRHQRDQQDCADHRRDTSRGRFHRTGVALYSYKKVRVLPDHIRLPSGGDIDVISRRIYFARPLF